MIHSAEFERFTNFMVRMIEKYGDEVNQEMTATKLEACSVNNDMIESSNVDTPERGCPCA